MTKIVNKIRKLVGFLDESMPLGTKETANYWNDHNVTLHHEFTTATESFEYFEWRNDQYFNYIQLMPVSGQDQKVVLDYGCGPGHDMVGFASYSKPKKIIGIDLSASSLAEAEYRLNLHGIDFELIRLEENDTVLPFEDESIDYIHSSGVLHHTNNPVAILKELNRVLKSDGSMRIMVYNYESIWVHLYVAYKRAILQGLYSNDELGEQFRRSTDGDSCPISNCYKPSEWIEISRLAGFDATFLGAAISMHEMEILPLRFAAIQDRRLPANSRKFLLNLTFDQAGYPLVYGEYAGIDACYSLVKKR